MNLPALLLAACLPLIGGGDDITAADLAPVEPAFSVLPPAAPLTYAPLPGARRILDAAEIKRLAGRFGISVDPHAPVCLERGVAPLNPEDLLAAMRSALALPDAQIELVECSRYPAPRGAIEFLLANLARPAAPRAQSAVLWKGAVRYGAGRRFSIWVRVRIQSRFDCVVAAQTLTAGHPIEAGQLRREIYTGFPLFEPSVASVEEAVRRVPRRTIPAGVPVLASTLDEPFDIRRGDKVEVEVLSGDALVKLDARAAADGRRGQTIPIINPTSGKRFQARIESAGKVVVGVHP
jgi:flagella basal body P-ring formation protein FlgA